MNQKVICVLILMVLLGSPFGVCIGQTKDPLDATKERAAQAHTKKQEVVITVRNRARVLVGPKALPYVFHANVSLGGKITEIRDETFTLTSGQAGKDQVDTIISYDDVLIIKHLSGFGKAMKGAGRVFGGIGAGAVVLPVYGILALLGKLPDC
jgi:hypothetical protein